MPQFNIKIGILVTLLVSFYSARKTSTIESRLENNSLCTPGCVAEESCIPPPEFCDPAQSECFCPSNCFPNCDVLFINPCDTHLCEAPTLGTYPSNCYYDARDLYVDGSLTINSRDLPDLYQIEDGLDDSIDWCRKKCGEVGHTYAGVQYTRQCWCGSSFGSQGRAADADCSRECKDKARENRDEVNMCGGNSRNNIYTSIPKDFEYTGPAWFFGVFAFMFVCCRNEGEGTE